MQNVPILIGVGVFCIVVGGVWLAIDYWRAKRVEDDRFARLNRDGDAP